MNGPALILIVEDNEANRLLAGAVLEREGTGSKWRATRKKRYKGSRPAPRT